MYRWSERACYVQLGSPAARLVPPKGLLSSIKWCAPFHQRGTSIGSSEFENEDWHKSIVAKVKKYNWGFLWHVLCHQKILNLLTMKKTVLEPRHVQDKWFRWHQEWNLREESRQRIASPSQGTDAAAKSLQKAETSTVAGLWRRMLGRWARGDHPDQLEDFSVRLDN